MNAYRIIYETQAGKMKLTTVHAKNHFKALEDFDNLHCGDRDKVINRTYYHMDNEMEEN